MTRLEGRPSARRRNPFRRLNVDGIRRWERVVGLPKNFWVTINRVFALGKDVCEVESNYLQAMGEIMSVRNKSASKALLERRSTRVVLATHWICASVVMMFTSSISSSCLGDLKIVHQGASSRTSQAITTLSLGDVVPFFIECDSWGCNIEVYRTGQSLCVADYFPRGTSKIVTVVFP